MSLLHGGAYCLLSHVGVKTALIECLVRNVDDLSDSKLRDMVKFAAEMFA